VRKAMAAAGMERMSKVLEMIFRIAKYTAFLLQSRHDKL
jgi:hypothetical protein